MSFLALVLAGCTGGDTATCSTDGEGALTFTPTLPGDPLDTKPQLYVYDTDGTFVAQLGSGDADVPLAAGPYYVGFGTALGTADADGFRAMYGLLADTVQAICVADGETTELSPAYEAQPAGEHLWFSAGETLAAVAPGALVDGATVTPDLRLDVTPVNDFRGFAFDRLGNLWAATSDTYGVRLLEFPPGAVSAGGAVEPSLTITNTLFDDHANIKEIGFAADGTLVVAVGGSYSSWVGLQGFGEGAAVVAIAEEQAVVEPSWQATVAGLVAPADLAFDGAGNLWLTDTDAPALVRLDPATFATGELTPAATVSVTVDDLALRGPTDLAFAADGSLVVDYWTDGQVVTLDGAALSASGTFTVAGTSTLSDVMSLPSGLAVTGAGTVWYGDEAGVLRTEAGATVMLDGMVAPTDLAVVATGF